MGVLAPYTGQDAAFGLAMYAGCVPAVRAINAAGGVMGHQLSCKEFDTRGDPADAIPATRQMIASTPNLLFVLGCTSDEASSVVPILEQNHIPSFCVTGESQFNKNDNKYFYRMVPPDQYEAYAMVAIARNYDKFSRVALVFGNDIGSQTFVGPATAAVKATGGTVVINQAIALGQPSYRTEVEQLLNAKPDVILTEAIGSTDATYLAELKQLNHGVMLPVIGSSATIDPVWFKAVTDAIGLPDVLQYFQADDIPTNYSGPGYQEFKTNLLASTAEFAAAASYAVKDSTIHLYDGAVMAALAADSANSIDPKIFNSWIVKVGNGIPGATEVNTYADGVQALKSGKTVRFIGAGCPTHFSQYQNSECGYIVAKYAANGDEQTVAPITQAQMDQLIQEAGA